MSRIQKQLTLLFLLVGSLFLSVSCRTTKNYNSGPIYVLRVEPSDTLAGIAQKYDTTWQRIASRNDISNPRNLQIGQLIRVKPGPMGRIYKGQRGLGGPTTVSSKGAAANQSGSGGLFFGGLKKLQWPLTGRVTSKYGRRWGRFHHGIDIAGKPGSKVRAAAGGRVISAGRKGSFGQTVVLQHKGYTTLYAHCQRLLVSRGDWVAQGQSIGLVGSTGRSTGPHLHFELRDTAGKSIDPLKGIGRYQLVSAR